MRSGLAYITMKRVRWSTTRLIINRRIFMTVLVFSGLFVLLLGFYAGQLYDIMNNYLLSEQLTEKENDFLIRTEGCYMPAFNAFDPSVMKFVKYLAVPYICSDKPSFLVIKPNAVVDINSSILQQYYGVKASSVKCDYQEILRDSGTFENPTDDKYILTGFNELTFGIPLEREFIYAKCFDSRNFFHDEYLALTPLKPDVETSAGKAYRKNRRERLNVIMIGTDSTSKLNFIRHFHKTRKYLQKDLNAIELLGYNKVGENTFPNTVPLLSGVFPETFWNSSMPEFLYDKVDLIWRHFAKIGYRTLFAEDAPLIATFNFQRRGFRNPPADYYPRPFALAVEKCHMRERSKENCFDDRMEMKVFYDYTKSFIQTMEDRPYFTYTFLGRLTHDENNFAAYADEPTYEFLNYLHSSNVTNNSVVFFFSDHGMRFGEVRETLIGKFEERWPIMFILFPKWFLTKYPWIAKNLKTNQKRLTTQFDVHQTMVDILKYVSGENLVEQKADLNFQGISLFREIPPERTCQHAKINPHYCTCEQRQQVPVNRQDVRITALYLIKHINAMFNDSHLCAALTLDVVKDAQVTHPEDNARRYLKPKEWKIVYRQTAKTDYLITLRTEPSGALFEGTVRSDHQKNEHSILGQISRLNRYNHQGDCVKDPELRKFCYCKTQTTG